MTGLALRPVQPTPEEEAFLITVYASARAEEMQNCEWSQREKEEFLAMQYRFREKAYRMKYPEAETHVVVLDKECVGRLTVARTAGEIVLADIALLPGFRNRGIGTQLIKGLQLESTECARPVVLCVLVSNPAACLYERLGFRVIQQSDTHYKMKWQPGV